MGVFVRAVVTGFGFSLGAALYRRVSARLGLDETEAKTDKHTSEGARSAAAEDPETNDAVATAANLPDPSPRGVFTDG